MHKALEDDDICTTDNVVVFGNHARIKKPEEVFESLPFQNRSSYFAGVKYVSSRNIELSMIYLSST